MIQSLFLAPQLAIGHYSVIAYDIKSGSVLAIKKNETLTTENMYQDFDDYANAYNFVNEKIKQNPSVEYTIYDHEGHAMLTKSFFGER